MQRFSTARTSKIYPTWDFWLENKPSGNPGMDFYLAGRVTRLGEFSHLGRSFALGSFFIQK
jgi:hypothetical protein